MSVSERLIGVAVVSILVGFSALAFVVTNQQPNTSGLTSEQVVELFNTLRQDSVAAQKHLHLTERVETKERVDAVYQKLNTLADSITQSSGNRTLGQPAPLNDTKAANTASSQQAKLATEAQGKITELKIIEAKLVAELESKLAAVS